MAEKSQINSPRVGMNTDTAPQDLKETQYTHALNAVVLSSAEELNQAVIQNESSNLLTITFPSGYKVIRALAIPEQNRTLFFLVNPTSATSMIGELFNCTYDDSAVDDDSFMACDTCTFPILREDTPLENTTQAPFCSFNPVVISSCLSFSIDHKINAAYKILDSQLNVYFTDNSNQRRFLYFDYDASGKLKLQDKFKVISGYDPQNCDQPIYSSELDCNKAAYHPRYSIPCITNIRDIPGGELKAGTYQFFIAYTDKEANPLTNYFPATNPYPIFTKPETFETNYSTDRAISFSVSELDQNLLYPYFTVVVAETIDNFTQFKQVGTYPVAQHSVTYSGKSVKDLTENDVFFRMAFYKAAGGVATANKHLIFSDLSSWKRPNLQRVANRVKVYWQTVAIPEAVYADPRASVKYRGFQRDEVQALGMVFVTKEGEELGTYHIPGPSKSYLQSTYGVDVSAVVDNNDVITEDQCLDNCCGEASGNQKLSGSVTLACSDNGCTQQGQVSLNFTFPQATTSSHTLYIGHVNHSDGYVATYGSADVVQGHSFFEAPAGTAPWGYYDYPDAPFVITIPAGVTSFTASNITIQKYLYETAKLWVCHGCLFPITDIFFKVAEVGVDADFTTTDSWAVHNVPGEAVAPPTDCEDCSQETWKVYNTARVVGTPHEVLDNCDSEDKVWEWGECAYWESTEKYPNDPLIWGELCNQPIRHLKLPDSSITHIHDNKDGSKTFQESNIVYPIGFRIDHQSVIDAINYCVANGIISSADRDRIASYRVVRGNRVGNKSIVAKGLLYDMWKYNKWSKDYYYPNYPYNDLRPDNFLAPTSSTYTGSNTSSPSPSTFTASGRYTFHSPDTHFNSPKIGTRLKLETLEYGQSEGFFNHCEDQSKYKLLSTAAMTLALAAGIATAFSVERDKECTVYNFKSSSTTVGTETSHSTWSEHLFAPYNKDNGLPIGVPTFVESFSKTTCHGKPYQLLNPISTNPAGLFLQQAIYLGLIAMKEMQIIMDLIEALVPLKNMAIQYNSVGKYTSFKAVGNTGNKQRAILRSAYLDPKIQMVDELVDASTTDFQQTYINNWNRESSVYLKVDPDKLLPSPSVADQSRFTMTQKGLSQSDLRKRVNAPISSYYASIKYYVPDQWGKIGNIEYLPTGTCDFRLDRPYTVNQSVIFGGDTFITRFALKRKMPFFIQTRFRDIAEADVRYDELGNVAYPNYYFNSKQPISERLADITLRFNNIGAAYQRLLGVPKSRLDVRATKFFYQSGFIHLYNYGIPYFFAESDVNCDFRFAQNSKERDFYPHQKDLDYWLQEKNVPITEDNYYFYNKTYSKQNREAVVAPQVMKLESTEARDRSSLIQSEQEQFRPDIDKWLIFKPNNKFRFSPEKGRVIGVDGIENDKVLVRFENGAQIFGAYQTIQTDSNTIAVGNGGIFNNPMKEFATTTLGFAGSQHSDMLQTEFGHIWVDAKRGQVFNLLPNAQGLDELTKDGMRSWFEKNLKFQLKKDFPQIGEEDLDNNFKGIGITLGYDKKNARILITKLDYRLLDKAVTYSTVTRKFYKGNAEVALSDLNYFCNKSWTVSYSFLTKSWTSFHSYLPNYYVSYVDNFYTGDNSVANLWSHSQTNRSYQVFNGKLQPFKVEIVASPMMLNGTLNSVAYITNARRYQGPGDYAVNKYITFTKAEIYNDQQASGPLYLNVRDENNLHQSIKYPIVEGDKVDILVTNLKNVWYFNQFWDAVAMQPNNQPLMLNNCAHSDKIMNLKALNLYKPDLLKQRFEGPNTKIRFTQDSYSNYNILFTLVKTQING